MVFNLLKSTAMAWSAYVRSEQPEDLEPLVPNPGSLSSTLYVPSLNNILQLAAPLIANEVFQNKTINPNVTMTGFTGSIEIDSVHINSVDGFDLKDLSFIEGTDTLQLSLGGINIDTELVGMAKLLHLVPCSIDALKIENFTMIVATNTSSVDGVRFKVGGESWFHIEDF